MPRNRIIYTGAFRFPDGDAAAARVLGVAKALRSIGYEVYFAGWEEKRKNSEMGNVYEGFSYFSQSEFGSVERSLLSRLLGYLFAGRKTIKWLEQQDMSSVDSIVAYHGGAFFLLQLYAFCKKKGVNLVFDCTEWYDPRQLPGGYFGIPYWDSSFRMKVLYPIFSRGIVISSYLRDYYRSQGVDVVMIPPLVDIYDDRWRLRNRLKKEAGLTLVYAGTPGRKDSLSDILIALGIVVSEGFAVRLILIGPSRADVSRLLGDHPLARLIEACLDFRGRVSQGEVPILLQEADFSVLVRPRRRYTRAGFSTKMVESLAAGVPVIMNKTGDADMYIKNKCEGIFLQSDRVDDIADGFRAAILLSSEERESMRLQARSLAEREFNYYSCVDRIARFFNRAA